MTIPDYAVDVTIEPGWKVIQPDNSDYALVFGDKEQVVVKVSDLDSCTAAVGRAKGLPGPAQGMPAWTGEVYHSPTVAMQFRCLTVGARPYIEVLAADVNVPAETMASAERMIGVLHEAIVGHEVPPEKTDASTRTFALPGLDEDVTLSGDWKLFVRSDNSWVLALGPHATVELDEPDDCASFLGDARPTASKIIPARMGQVYQDADGAILACQTGADWNVGFVVQLGPDAHTVEKDVLAGVTRLSDLDLDVQ